MKGKLITGQAMKMKMKLNWNRVTHHLKDPVIKKTRKIIMTKARSLADQKAQRLTFWGIQNKRKGDKLWLPVALRNNLCSIYKKQKTRILEIIKISI